ncbi:MAG: single-stranded DNA-binding protein [Lachnospiraceae bacterium]|nr:single-stranded DNA-binding protein [Lachnospiraceae bacterium]
MSKKQNKGQDRKPDFLADLNADILDDLTAGGRISNAAGLVGELTELDEVTDICGLRFNGYLAKIETKRPSGIIDEVAVAFTEAAVDRGQTGDGLRLENYFLPGSRLLISGQQQALKDFKSGKVLVFILAEYIGLSPKALQQNDIALMGELVYKPTHRTTPRGKRISDIFVKAKNMLTGASCYIPCICWQESADEVAGWQPGDRVKLLGRCQSREYRKETETGREIRTAYEISVSFIKRTGEAGNV